MPADQNLRDGETKKRNRLAGETSPYLLQHADNPVDWYPWGEEALSKARELDRPIFLSIGYSACHWCHVMEHECFENPQIAELMNRWFINIKVDREERPDLDQIYMNAVLAISGHGGWPLSVFLTPDLKPFYGGTYWPPEARMGLPGFRDILSRVHQAWETHRDEIDLSAAELTEHVAKLGQPFSQQQAELDEALLRNAMRELLASADRDYGGFGPAPKFPHAVDLRLLLRCWKRFDSRDALEVVDLTLNRMACGGIYDHLGGGFHRYSTDARWLVPHFEKMLYDNALLASAYLEAYQATGHPDSARVARETLDYVLREMTQPEGGFYSTQDADSEGEEGKYFVWSEEEIKQHLAPDEARVFCYCYDVSAAGNWEGKNILNRPKSDAQAARLLQIEEEELAEILARCRRKLFAVRQQRVAPGRDEKVLVAWNGLMIAAMAQAGQVFGEERYTETARRAADFILEQMRDGEGRLRHVYKDGQARLNAYQDDYACLIDGLVELYQATFDVRYLQEALDLTERMIDQYYDRRQGGFFYTAVDHERLIVRSKQTQDQATPSGNGTAASALLKLGRLCGRTDLEEIALQTLRALSGQLTKAPMASGQSLMAVDFLLGPACEVAVVEGTDVQQSAELFRALYSRFVPNKVVLRRPYGLADRELPAPLRPVLAGKRALQGQATVYVCQRGTCRQPVTGPDALAELLP